MMGMPFLMCGPERPHQMFSDGDDGQVMGGQLAESGQERSFLLVAFQ